MGQSSVLIGYPGGRHLACSGFPVLVPKKKFPFLARLVRSRWLDIGLVFFCVFVDLDFVPVYKNSQKELDRYPTIMTMLGQKRICILLLILCVLV